MVYRQVGGGTGAGDCLFVLAKLCRLAMVNMQEAAGLHHIVMCVGENIALVSLRGKYVGS